MSDTAPFDSADLASSGLLRPSGVAGTHRIHKRRLIRSSNEENRDIPLNISSSSPATEDAFAMIPISLISRETLIYVGFTKARATEIWTNWSKWPLYGPRRETDEPRRETDIGDHGLIVTFKDYITGRFDNRDDAIDEDGEEKWRACLDDYGIATDVQDAIMDPHFIDLGDSESCIYWVKDTIEMRYAGLEDIQRASRERDMKLRRLAGR